MKRGTDPPDSSAWSVSHFSRDRRNGEGEKTQKPSSSSSSSSSTQKQPKSMNDRNKSDDKFRAFGKSSRNQEKTTSSTQASNAAPRQRHDLAKTEICVFYAMGKCPRGAACGFAHGEEELRMVTLEERRKKNLIPSADKYKTSLCATWIQTGSCKYFDRCTFAHDARLAAHIEATVVSVSDTFGAGGGGGEKGSNSFSSSISSTFAASIGSNPLGKGKAASTSTGVLSSPSSQQSRSGGGQGATSTSSIASSSAHQHHTATISIAVPVLPGSVAVHSVTAEGKGGANTSSLSSASSLSTLSSSSAALIGQGGGSSSLHISVPTLHAARALMTSMQVTKANPTMTITPIALSRGASIGSSSTVITTTSSLSDDECVGSQASPTGFKGTANAAHSSKVGTITPTTSSGEAGPAISSSTTNSSSMAVEQEIWDPSNDPSFTSLDKIVYASASSFLPTMMTQAREKKKANNTSDSTNSTTTPTHASNRAPALCRIYFNSRVNRGDMNTDITTSTSSSAVPSSSSSPVKGRVTDSEENKTLIINSNFSPTPFEAIMTSDADDAASTSTIPVPLSYSARCAALRSLWYFAYASAFANVPGVMDEDLVITPSEVKNLEEVGMDSSSSMKMDISSQNVESIVSNILKHKMHRHACGRDLALLRHAMPFTADFSMLQHRSSSINNHHNHVSGSKEAALLAYTYPSSSIHDVCSCNFAKKIDEEVVDKGDCKDDKATTSLPSSSAPHSSANPTLLGSGSQESSTIGKQITSGIAAKSSSSSSSLSSSSWSSISDLLGPRLFVFLVLGAGVPLKYALHNIRIVTQARALPAPYVLLTEEEYKATKKTFSLQSKVWDGVNHSITAAERYQRSTTSPSSSRNKDEKDGEEESKVSSMQRAYDHYYTSLISAPLERLLHEEQHLLASTDGESYEIPFGTVSEQKNLGVGVIGSGNASGGSNSTSSSSSSSIGVPRPSVLRATSHTKYEKQHAYAHPPLPLLSGRSAASKSAEVSRWMTDAANRIISDAYGSADIVDGLDNTSVVSSPSSSSSPPLSPILQSRYSPSGGLMRSEPGSPLPPFPPLPSSYMYSPSFDGRGGGAETNYGRTFANARTVNNSNNNNTSSGSGSSNYIGSGAGIGAPLLTSFSSSSNGSNSGMSPFIRPSFHNSTYPNALPPPYDNNNSTSGGGAPLGDTPTTTSASSSSSVMSIFRQTSNVDMLRMALHQQQQHLLQRVMTLVGGPKSGSGRNSSGVFSSSCDVTSSPTPTTPTPTTTPFPVTQHPFTEQTVEDAIYYLLHQSTRAAAAAWAQSSGSSGSGTSPPPPLPSLPTNTVIRGSSRSDNLTTTSSSGLLGHASSAGGSSVGSCTSEEQQNTRGNISEGGDGEVLRRVLFE